MFIKPWAKILNFIKDQFKKKVKTLLKGGEDKKSHGHL